MFKFPNFVTSISQIPELAGNKELAEVERVFPLKCSRYYLDLIDLEDPNDPLRRIVLPHPDELNSWGRMDPSNEKRYTVMEGLQHKYDSTALVLASPACAGFCRYCFRKRLFTYGKRVDETLKDTDALIDYISRHPEINNVILSGGDALMLPTNKLKELISKLRQIDHVNIIRLGTKVTSYIPERITEDEELLELIKRYSTPQKRIYVMTHFDHPKEITPKAIEACNKLIKAGAVPLNQTPLIRGVNDNPKTLAELFKKLTSIGVGPYYVFQCRPATGNKPYAVPIEEGYRIFEDARSMCSGLSKRARFTMSHADGKFDIIALTDELVIFKLHRAAENRDSAKILAFKRNPEAYWLDDYKELVFEARK